MLVLLENGGQGRPIRECRNRVTRVTNSAPRTGAADRYALPKRSRFRAF
jgi:hypothetical protein